MLHIQFSYISGFLYNPSSQFRFVRNRYMNFTRFKNIVKFCDFWGWCNKSGGFCVTRGANEINDLGGCVTELLRNCYACEPYVAWVLGNFASFVTEF